MPNAFDGVMVFSATLARQRDELGSAVEAWIAANPQLEIVDIVLRQSSDDRFHCLSITIFHRRRPLTQPPTRVRRGSR